ncbi:sulfatase-like hydrolase/transferase [Candidatus Saccharibacteria bacterium]|nr:sulfatase-like hydrolase/transferase [Candidatus Saccharibacteria bacterium]
MKNLKKLGFKKYFKEIFKKYLSKKSQENAIKYAKIGKKIIQSKVTFLIFSTICIYLLGAFLAKYILNLQFGGWEKANEFLSKNPKIAEYSQIITILVSFLFVGIFRNWRISMGVLFSLATIMMYINAEKIASRNTPFLPEDLAMSGEAGGLASMINFGRFSNMLFMIVVIIIITIIANKISKKIWHFKFSKKQKIAIFIPQAALILICAHFLNLHTLEIRNLSGKGTFIKVENLETSIDFTDQAYNYQTNGFILATISNLQAKTQKQPEGYSKEAVQKIVQKYKKIAEEKNKNRKKLSDEKVNVVYVMSESFIDPKLGKHLYDYGNKEPIPYTQEIKKSQSSGWAASSEYGGGTANVEFEALTGLSNFFLNSIPYTSIVPANKDTPSIVKNFNENGYKTIAMHPYNRNMYRREVVYPNLGFQEYKSADNFKNNSKIDNSKYISDESAFNEVLAELKNSQKPKFIHLVTMQNHMPYEENAYSEHNFSVNAKNGANPDNTKTIRAYLEGISRSDKAMKNFISEIKKLNEKTIVVFWGDHWPGIYGEMFEKELNKNDIRRTPLFVYSNFAKEKQDLGTSSLIYNQILALNAFDSKLSPFQYLLSDLREKYPTLTKQFVKANEKSDILKDFEMIEYDILSGNKYSLGDFYKVK